MHLTPDQVVILQACGYHLGPVPAEQAWHLAQQRRVFRREAEAITVRRPDGFLETTATLQHMLHEHAAAMDLVAAAEPVSEAQEPLPSSNSPTTSTPVPAVMLSNTTVTDAKIDLLDKTTAPAISRTDAGQPGVAPQPEPAVPIAASITPDYLVCLEDGRQLKMLKRHLRTAYNMTPEQYRARWDLPPDYPMVAPNAAERRAVISRQPRPGAKSRAGSNGMLDL